MSLSITPKVAGNEHDGVAFDLLWTLNISSFTVCVLTVTYCMAVLRNLKLAMVLIKKCLIAIYVSVCVHPEVFDIDFEKCSLSL